MFWRGVFKRIAILSLLTGGALIALAVRSYFRDDAFTYQRIDGHLWGIVSDRGRLALACQRTPFNNGFQLRVRPSDGRLAKHSPWLGFGANLDAGAGLRFVISPHVVVAAVAFIPGAIWLRLAWRRRRESEANCCCVQCGYDLRATPDRCPECGKPVTPVPALVRPC